MSPVYKLSNAGGFTSKQRYTSMLAGNPVFQPSSFESIATVTVGSGGSANVQFSSIPGTYTHLQVRIIGQDNGAGTSARGLNVRFNSDSASSYAYHDVYGDGSSALVNATSSATVIFCGYFAEGGSTNTFGTSVIDILDYANTNKYKTLRSLTGYDANGSGRVALQSGLWQSTAAVTSLSFDLRGDLSGTFAQYSHFALYGIKVAS